MPKLILLLAIALALFIVLARIRALPPAQRKRQYFTLGFGLLLIAAILLAATGRMHWLGAALTGLAVLLRQLLPILLPLVLRVLPSLRSRSGPSNGKQSTVETRLLRMSLDHDSGALDGLVLSGSFTGKQLADLDRAQLEQLFRECVQSDQDSARLLDSYFQARFGEPAQASGPNPTPPTDGDMTTREALAILGLPEGADRKTIIDAHRKLMQKLHPDRGGNDYLAAKINQAKTVLLGRRQASD